MLNKLAAWVVLLVAMLIAAPESAWAARFLFVSDTATDTNIPGVLRAEGHVVDVVLNDFNPSTSANTRLQGSLAGYDGVFWSATGAGGGSVHAAATMTNLSAYVSAGGYLFVTGYDSVASPTDLPLIGLVGGTSSIDVPDVPAAAISTAGGFDLTTGVVDLRGVTPTGGSSDRDALTGLGADTTAVVTTRGVPEEAQWTLRLLGSGRIAYVSNGDGGPASAHPSWTTTTAGGAGAYNGALRNFAFHASGANVLFVSDTATDTNIPEVLRALGHKVTTVLNDYNVTTTANARLQGTLSNFDVVIWSATGSGGGSVHAAATMTNLSAYVSAGGYLFVTGYDSVASPLDPPLIGLIGGTSSIDVPGAPAAAISTEAGFDLTTGVVDLRGVVPSGGSGDRDAITGLGADTTAVVTSANQPMEAQWTVRLLGTGRIAYVSNGDLGPTSAHPSWANTTAGGAGAYNGALRNFVFHASGSRVLFVSDSATDTNIPAVLRRDGHRVTVVLNDFNAALSSNTRLQAPITGFDAVVWSATGGGFGSVAPTAVITNLTSFVNAGGRVFVTGYDSIASPTDPPLIGFVGGTGSVDTGSGPGTIISAANELNTGLVDLRGVTPTGAYSDLDTLTGAGTGTTIVCPSSSSSAQGQWVLRTLGAGRIAYVSNGQEGPASALANWADTTAGGAGAYNGAVRNFIFNIDRVQRGVTFGPGAANGTACTNGIECGSGFCVDGVCCNSACAGGSSDCQACAASAGAAVNGTCGPVSAGRVCRAANGTCDAAETCDGTATTCPADTFAANTVVCRTSAGPCDLAETCTGTSAACPSDGFAPTSTVCRPAAMGGCDVAETCAGNNAECPADAVATAGTVCRPAVMGGCDVSEVCSGTSSTCPTDAFAAAGSMCRPSMGPCDVGETCTGMTPACPTDAFAPPTTVCRMSTGACDTTETCSGMSASCPSDGFAMDGTSCADTVACNGDETCRGGMCLSGTAPSCEDNDPCTMGMCVEPTGCRQVPIPNCGATDAGTDGGDGAATDGSADDASSADASSTDASSADASGTDASSTDASGTDASSTDASSADASSTDASSADGAVVANDVGGDAGVVEDTLGRASGCGCAVPGRSNRAGAGLLTLFGLAAIFSARRRRAASSPR